MHILHSHMPLSKEIIRQTLATARGEHGYKIVEMLSDAGHEAWWVGGSVRDMLLGKIPTDIDIATSARPQDVLKLFARNDDASAAFGSVRVMLGQDTFEVTTFREDDEASDGRHPESVLFGTRQLDAKRRDFTLNAMYWQPVHQEFYDPLHGEADLHERLIRFIGEPALRIRHDALRILRAVRFRAALRGQYHPDTYRALEEQSTLVEILSGERVRTELEKMLLGPHPDTALRDLWDTGVSRCLLPELAACKGIPQPADYHREGDVWEHMMLCLHHLRAEDTPDARVAILFHDCGKAETFSLRDRIRFDHHASISADLAAAALRRLQFPAQRMRKIDWLIRHHMSMTFLDMPDERKGHWYFHPWFPELLQVFFLDIAGTQPADFSLLQKIERDYHHFLDRHPRPEKPLLNGEQVMELLHLSPGEEVGRILGLLEKAQLRKEISSKAEAKDFILQQAATR